MHCTNLPRTCTDPLPVVAASLLRFAAASRGSRPDKVYAQRWACKTKLLARLQTFCSARYGYVVFCLSTFFGLLRAAWRRVKLLQ